MENLCQPESNTKKYKNMQHFTGLLSRVANLYIFVHCHQPKPKIQKKNKNTKIQKIQQSKKGETVHVAVGAPDLHIIVPGQSFCHTFSFSTDLQFEIYGIDFVILSWSTL